MTDDAERPAPEADPLADSSDASVEQLPPAEEADVVQLLRSLPRPAMPGPLAAHLDATLRTATDSDSTQVDPTPPPANTERSAPTTGPAAATVLPFDDAARSHRATGTPNRRSGVWGGRVLGVAAGVAAILLVSGVAVSVLSGRGGDDATTAASSASPVDPASVPVVLSGTNYTASAFPQQLNTVLASAVTGASGRTAPSSSVTAPAEGTPESPDSLRAAPGGYSPSLQQCVAGLTDDPTAKPLAADYARFETRPALVIAVPGSQTPGTVQAFVVSRGCTGGPDVQVYYYRLVTVAELPALAGYPLPQPSSS